MEELLQNLLGNTEGVVAYLSVFGILVACGLGIPLPEDISLILGGYLAHIGAASLPVMMAVGFLGILAGDSMIFFAGRRVGTRVSDGHHGFLARIVTPEKRAKVEALFASHGQKIVMIARFLPGVRAVTYFTAGSAGMSYWRFVFFDGVAALASAPLFVYLGWKFGGELDVLTEKLKDGQFVVIGAIVVAAVAYLLYRRRRNSKARAELMAPTAVVAPIAPVSSDHDQAAGSIGDKPNARDLAEPYGPRRDRSGLSLGG